MTEFSRKLDKLFASGTILQKRGDLRSSFDLRQVVHSLRKIDASLERIENNSQMVPADVARENERRRELDAMTKSAAVGLSRASGASGIPRGYRIAEKGE
jgi:hypothetical protein